ncbi:MAG: peptidylprolyl isomerase [Bdellovibrionaceae bacterium]|nr:peptidylprolyl isomerase [Pseudobdellovibrionaceae bacterium]MBX3034520.1 peptidylprolyl isomerase [Pseudobdellovibrionaceae bacterium]
MKRHLAHILVEHRYEAEDLLRQLRGLKEPSEFGPVFEKLARRHSRCPSAAQGGDLGLIDLRRLDPVFSEEAEGLAVNALSPIVRTRFGHHLIWRKA